MRSTKQGDTADILITQISIGGCLTDWDDNIFIGDEFRMLLRLPNANYLPLTCKAIYKFADNGIGSKFLDLTLFEQELLASIITEHLEDCDLPQSLDPFAQPRKITAADLPASADARREQDEMLENIL